MLNQPHFLDFDWDKVNGMLPAIIQDFYTYEILMHGYMNKEALLKTQKDFLVTFYSRTKDRLWTKGESSGNYLKVVKIIPDCDHDVILILAKSTGKTCHLGNKSCFLLEEKKENFLFTLEKIIEKRKNVYKKNSYTSNLYDSGTSYIAQKVGEEAIETILAAVKKDKNELINESSDLFYHFMVLLHDQGLNFNMILDNLRNRHKQ